uniref:Uncharacterized protein n=1 Tax=Arundo donax TaxID=35708 RepID=A0A0A9DLR3_ARUDO
MDLLHNEVSLIYVSWVVMVGEGLRTYGMLLQLCVSLGYCMFAGMRRPYPGVVSASESTDTSPSQMLSTFECSCNLGGSRRYWEV